MALNIGLSVVIVPWVIVTDPLTLLTENLVVDPSVISNVCEAPPINFKTPVPTGSNSISPLVLVEDILFPSIVILSTFHD